MGTKSEIQAAAYRAEERERVKIDLPPSPEPSVARVTLEFSGQLRAPPSQWPWDLILSGACIVRSEPGESVRVVEECCLDRINMGEVIRQRDAAIREREELRDNYRHCRAANTLVCDERDTLKARVVELEGQLESVADRAAAAETALEAAPAASGWRTERVTLEITQFPNSGYKSPSEWPWELFLRGEALTHGESVRVVDEANDALSIAEPFLQEIEDIRAAGVILNGRVAEITDERDAAIREREELRRSFQLSEDANTLICDERDTLRARVVELEAAVADCNILLGDRWREAVSAVTGKAAPAASDAAGTEVVSAEAVAWGVMVHRDAAVLCVPFTVIEAADHFVRLNGVNERMQVVPLYAAPQPAKGWLTPEQREAIMYLIANRSQFAPQTPHEERRNAASRVCHDILARSSPPEVVAPKYVETHDAFRNCAFKVRDADWRAALAAAGVTVKEVG